MNKAMIESLIEKVENLQREANKSQDDYHIGLWNAYDNVLDILYEVIK